jgi:superfamily II DNA or RNA helicase
MNDSLPDYSYQVPLVAKVLAHLEKGRGVVLAATPGAGKTNMAINVITKLATPGKRVLVLTQGQNILKDQFFNRLKEVGAPFTFGVLSRTTVPDVQVHVALPQWAGFRKGRAPKYDYIVIDEAHHWFTAPSEQAILAQNPKAKLLLLTGTPSRFVKSKEFPIEFITIQELLEYNVLTDPYIEIVQTNLPMTLRDYNMQSGELLNDTEFTPQHIAAAMDAVLDALLKRLKSRARDPKLHHSWLKKGLEWNAILGSLEKTMVIAHDQDQARKIKDYFNKAGVEVALSTSDDDADSTQVANFTAKPDVSVLIVVRRGILGFDFKQLQNIIDLSCSMSPDTNFQALCRVVRKHGDARKLYLKVTPIYMAPAIHHALAFTVALSMPDLFKSYDGDWKTVPVPKLKKPRTGEGEGDGPDGAEDDGKPNKKPKVPWPAMLPELLTFNELKHLDRTKDVSSIAYTTFNDVRELFYGQRVVTDEETNWKRLEAYLKRQAEAGKQ